MHIKDRQNISKNMLNKKRNSHDDGAFSFALSYLQGGNIIWKIIHTFVCNLYILRTDETMIKNVHLNSHGN